jgi:hypothetical protein
MKIDKYVDKIMEKFEYANGYSELSYDQLKKVITKYLVAEHDKEIEELAFQMETERQSGYTPNMDHYHKEYDLIKDKVIQKALDLAQTEKP